MTEPWQGERLDTLRALVADGLSASQIASAMKATSRSAVIGAAHRNHIALNGSVSQGERAAPGTRARRTRLKPSKPFVSGPPTEPVPIVPDKISTVAFGKPANIVDVQGCLWPIHGEGYETMFCNGKRRDGSKYCAGHWRTSVSIRVDTRRR